MNTAGNSALMPAWENGVHDAQMTFRAVLRALSEPGSLQPLPVRVAGPAPLEPATTALCLTLLDLDTPLWLGGSGDLSSVRAYLGFHCGCPVAGSPAEAAFGVVFQGADGFDLNAFSHGDIEYPDRAVTLLIQVPTLEAGPVRTISGPGIRTTAILRVGGLPENFEAMWRENAAGFPLGVDIVFCCGNSIVALPRTTQIQR